MGARLAAAAVTIALGVAAPGASLADGSCGLCARSVVINSALARCFLEKYPTLSRSSASAVAINLEDCETDRSVVAALRGPGERNAEPSRKFMLSLSQLVCLKHKLEEPDIELDPSAQIDLGSC